ncbi:MAG TPA: 1,2-phenylacetyl-CoA epoxidase subunit PaaC [Candidatus Limnocylindrales bacterium]|nr:1,2-phenylacetyl-CoA epoxidase subunit PaaC [Candidatus Limnocylindrales bacterium]
MTGPTRAAPPRLDPALRAPLAELLLAMADDEFVSGFTDSEWTGIAPLLEEDVAISSISQDELGHARALYQLLAEVLDDGRDEDAIAYDREPEDYRHARLLDHPRGDWATTIARRFLYELADEARLASIGDGWPPLADLVGKLRREERYHRMHLVAWINRLANGGADARQRLEAALAGLGPDAATVFTPLDGEATLLDAGVLTRSMADAEAAWRADLTAVLVPLGLPLPHTMPPTKGGREGHSDAFRWLWGEFTAVRHTEDGATW